MVTEYKTVQKGFLRCIYWFKYTSYPIDGITLDTVFGPVTTFKIKTNTSSCIC